MRVKRYCCQSSQLAYENYYKAQAGGTNIPYYRGSRYQRGHGLGNLFSGLFKTVTPLLKKGLASLGKSALKSGVSIAGDVLEGKKFTESARARLPEGIKNLARDTGLISSNSSLPGKVREEEFYPSNNRKRRASTKRGGTSKRRKFNDILN